jgi:hypothetical protein
MRLLLFGLASLPGGAGADEAAPRRLVVDVDFALADVNDNSLRWSLGRERQLKLPYAIVGFSGDIAPWLSYRVELNGVNESVKPEPFTPSEATPFFFPNQADPDYGVTSKPEGQYKVDDFKTTGWDPYIQEARLRRAFVDVHTRGGTFGLVLGRFFVAQGLPLEESRWFTSKDLTHVELINAATDQGAEGYWSFGPKAGRHGRLSAAVISGNGNPYHDYVYFDFTRGEQEDTNSAVGTVGALRVWPLPGLDMIAAYKLNFTGSLIESDLSLQRSKHYDDAFTAGARYRPPFFENLLLFGQYARYKWGLRDTSAEHLPGLPIIAPIYKEGVNLGLDLSAPISLFTSRVKGRVGVVAVREELDRDDSLIAILAAEELFGVTVGEKERTTIVKLYADFGPLTAFFFYNDLENPFPVASAIVPLSGPHAFTGPGNEKMGFGVRFKTSF